MSEGHGGGDAPWTCLPRLRSAPKAELGARGAGGGWGCSLGSHRPARGDGRPPRLQEWGPFVGVQAWPLLGLPCHRQVHTRTRRGGWSPAFRGVALEGAFLPPRAPRAPGNQRESRPRREPGCPGRGGRARRPGEGAGQAGWEGRRAVSSAACCSLTYSSGRSSVPSSEPARPAAGPGVVPSCGAKPHGGEPTVPGGGAEQAPRRRSERSFVGSVDSDLGPPALPKDLPSEKGWVRGPAPRQG